MLPDDYRHQLARQKSSKARSNVGARQPYLRRVVPFHRATGVEAIGRRGWLCGGFEMGRVVGVADVSGSAVAAVVGYYRVVGWSRKKPPVGPVSQSGGGSTGPSVRFYLLWIGRLANRCLPSQHQVSDSQGFRSTTTQRTANMGHRDSP